MGKIDIGTKGFLKISEIFAELFNVVVFKGMGRISPEDLEELDSVNDKTLELADGQLEFKEKFRDVKKLAKMGVCFRIILGVEEQTDVHYYMPVRCMAYDAETYEQQCNKIRVRAITEGKDFNPVNGVPKGTKILPVLTLVFYVGANEWDGPKELHDMFDIPDDKEDWVRQYIPNYPIYILDARHLSDEQVEQFSGELKAFFYMLRENYDNIRGRGYVARLKETWYAISAVKNDKHYAELYDQMHEQFADGGVEVDAALDRIEKRGVEIGEKRGIEIGEKRGIDNGVALSAKVFKAVKAGMTDNKLIAEKCGCTVTQVQDIRKAFDI